MDRKSSPGKAKSGSISEIFLIIYFREVIRSAAESRRKIDLSMETTKSEMFFVGLLIVVQCADVCSAGNIPLKVSEFTNLLTLVRVGTPPQSLAVEVDFTTRSIYMFVGSKCPPFVSCFISSLSSTNQFIGQRLEVSELTMSEGIVASDTFHFHMDSSILCQYQIVSSENSVSLRGRDVAGSIGLGRGSPFVRGRIVSVMVDSPQLARNLRAYPTWRVSMDATLPPLPAGLWEVEAAVSSLHPGWAFRTQLLMGSRKIYHVINAAIVPNENDLVIPDGSRDTFLTAWLGMSQRYSVTTEGRVFVPCSSGRRTADLFRLPIISLRTFPMTHRYITILPEQLGYSGLLSSKTNYLMEGSEVLCPTRVRFTANTQSTWIFGVPLVASVASVHLDSIENKIRFRLIPGAHQRPQSVIPKIAIPIFDSIRIPTFAPPEVRREGGGSTAKLSIVLESGWSSTASGTEYILYSRYPVSISDEGKDIQFVLLKKRSGLAPLESRIPQVTKLDGVYHMPSLSGALVTRNGEYRLEFTYHIAQDVTSASYEIELVETTTSLTIQMKKVDMIIPLEYFDMSGPSLRGADSQLSDECTICMENISLGELEQSLPCKHNFHRSCIANWLGSTRKCPNCLSQVAIRSGASGTILVRAPLDI